jgi:hypothetical protein
VGEGDEGAVDDVVVVVEQALFELLDVLEPGDREVVVLQRVDQPPGERVDDLGKRPNRSPARSCPAVPP